MSDDISLSEAEKSAGIVRCDACPVLCRIRPGRAGACDRYANEDGKLVRVDPLVLLAKPDLARVAFVEGSAAWRGELGKGEGAFVTGIGATTTYPDYKPAPFIVSSRHDGVDMVTVVTEGIFSYCGVKVKIDTDRYLGPEQAAVRVKGEAVGHVTTAEYGSQMLSLGGVHHLTGGSKKEGVVTCEALLALCNREAVELAIDGGSTVVVQADRPPIVNGTREERMRVGCGSAAIGMFAPQWKDHVDEVIVVDDHITGVLSEHQGGRFLDMKPAGIRVRGRSSTPGRYFQVAEPGLGWGGTNVSDPLEIIDKIDPKQAWPGLKLLMVSTTGEHSAWFELDKDLKPQPAAMPAPVRHVVERIAENCEPALCTVLFMAGAGGSLRAGVTENPVRLTRSVRDTLTKVTLGGVPAYVWPGGGITLMVDVAQHAGEILRLCADAGAGGAHRIHPARRRLCRAGRLRLARRHARRCAARPQGARRRGRDDERRRRPPARRPAASAARADRPHHRGVRRGGRSRARLSARRSSASATSCRPWCASCRPCAGRSATPIRCCRGRWRAAWPRPCGRIAPSTSRPWPPSPAPSPTRCCRRWCAAARSTRPMSTTAATSPSISRRAMNCAPASSPTALDGVARLTLRPAGARHRHLGPRRPLLLPRHRRFGDRAGGDRRRRRRCRDPDRQCREHRSSVDRAPAGARARSRQRPLGPAGDRRRRRAARRR